MITSEESQIRVYEVNSCAIFNKTKERFGGLSNMAGGYPLKVNDVSIRTSEALYQLCRFPHLPEVQEMIVSERSPMTAKMKSKPFRKQSRNDWEKIRVKVMKWCLRVKMLQNQEKFLNLLAETGDMPIVELSTRDSFWGAKPTEFETLTGMNVLGRLLMDLRETINNGEFDFDLPISPLSIENFNLFGDPILLAERCIPIDINQVNSEPVKQMEMF